MLVFVRLVHDRFLFRGQNVLIIYTLFETAFQHVLTRGALIEGELLVAVGADRAEFLIRDAVLERDFVVKLDLVSLRRALPALVILFF